MAVIETILLAIFFFLLVILWSRRKGTFLTTWPVVGMIPGFLCIKSHNMLEFGTNILKQNGWTFVFKGPGFMNMDFLITSDPKNVHYILSKNFTNYPKGKPVLEIYDVLGDGIFNVDSDLWKCQRKIIHSLVKNRKFERYSQKIMLQKLEKGLFLVLDHVSELGMEVDMQDVFKLFTSDVYWLFGLGFDPNCLSVEFPEVQYVKAFDAIEEALFYQEVFPESYWKLQKWLQIGEEKKFTQAWGIHDKFLYEWISLKRQELSRRKAQLEEEELDLMTAFIIEEGGDQKELAKELKRSDKFLRDVATNLLVAGRDTLSAGLTWFLWLLATHPPVEHKILEEIKANMKGEMNWQEMISSVQDLDKLVYLHAVLCETLRLYPPVPINHKTAVEADVLPSGHPVNQNAKIFLSFYSMGRMEEIWGKDCLEFKPERWISEQGRIVRRPSYEFSTFSAGPRTCLGKDITLIQMKMVAAALILNYQVQVTEGYPVLPLPHKSITLHIEYCLKVRVSKRHAYAR
ncbi:putative Cytochrome P450 [Melia azedarach]|uniref:Cytochrome P450 n=1 Tax=Melia azedarach TaxID=155640 RepID=A0ACC1YNJ4_MELAZ|nr:putative Cytochrome P450 [Melia azedarach]